MRIEFSYKFVPIHLCEEDDLPYFCRHTTVEIIEEGSKVGVPIATATVKCHVNDKDVKFQARKAALKAAISSMSRTQRKRIWELWHRQENRAW